jgi:hypothetical protein
MKAEYEKSLLITANNAPSKLEQVFTSTNAKEDFLRYLYRHRTAITLPGKDAQKVPAIVSPEDDDQLCLKPIVKVITNNVKDNRKTPD